VGFELRRRGPERRQRRHRDDLARARVKRGTLVDFSIDGLEHIGRELGRHIAQRSINLVRRLAKDLAELLCAALAALQV